MDTYFKLLLLCLTLGSVGCTQMLSQRDHLAQMEQNDDGYFNPREDFPVMVGDTGRTWESPAERKRRTPSSLQEQQHERSQRFLKEELTSLEGKLSDEDYEFYDKNRKYLPSISERIYYLKLSRYERRDYLTSKGANLNERKAIKPYEEMFALRQSNIILGMSKSDVRTNWGRPARIEVAGNPTYENERWVYNVNGAMKYIYFESGRVGGWE